jgi:hypothetical protein
VSNKLFFLQVRELLEITTVVLGRQLDGQFRPLAGSSPFIGVRNKVEYVDEIKLETVCPIEKIADIIIALKAAHPYETPSYQYWEVNG